MFYVIYFSRQWNGNFFNMETFQSKEVAFNYAKIVGGNVFIKEKKTHLSSANFKLIKEAKDI